MADRGWFERYLEAFNRADYESFGAYYSDDVRFFGQAATLVGRAAILDFYRGIRARIDERVDLLSFVGSEAMIAAEIRTTLVPLEDWPDFPTGALVRGERRASINFAFYDLAGGKFTRIRSARFRRLL